MRAIRVLLVIVCGFALSSAPAQAVVGGKPSPPGSYRYVADVLIGGAFGCSGTLIAPDWVLTAGHCGSITGSLSMGLAPAPAAWPASFYTVQLGSVYADGRGGERHSVTRVVVDSDYIATNGTGNDVTLLQLDHPSRVRPMLIAAQRERRSWRPVRTSRRKSAPLLPPQASHLPSGEKARVRVVRLSVSSTVRQRWSWSIHS